MHTKQFIFIGVLLISSWAQAVLNLDTPENLLKKAATDRQQLRDVVLSIEQQLPEMRDMKTFESYFFLLDELKMDADRLGLDDLYPGAIQSIGTRMAAFGIKWVDLSLMPTERVAYYIKWMQVEDFANLLSYSAYQMQKITDPILLEKFSENVDYIIQNTTVVLKDRFDIMIGYRDLSSSIAIRFILNPNLSPEDVQRWARHIYTSQGLSFFIDKIQKNIYDITPEAKNSVHRLFIYLQISYQISDRLIDSPLSNSRDHISDLAIELIKKSYELTEPLNLESEINPIITQLSAHQLQSLATTLTSLSEPLILKNADAFVNMGTLLLKSLNQNGLNSESASLGLFLDRMAAGIAIASSAAEGTYEFVDASKDTWKLTLLKSHPFEVMVALSNEKKSFYISYYSIKYSTADQVFTASNIDPNTDTPSLLSVITFKLLPNHTIELSDIFGSRLKQITGTLTQALPALTFTDPSNLRRNDIYEGDIIFGTTTKARHVTLTIQSDGVSYLARLKDELGVIYDFTTGSASSHKEFSLTTARLQNTTWAHMRGTMDENELKARIVVGGKGFVSKEFILKRKSL